jgi:hypothetical protein
MVNEHCNTTHFSGDRLEELVKKVHKMTFEQLKESAKLLQGVTNSASIKWVTRDTNDPRFSFVLIKHENGEWEGYAKFTELVKPLENSMHQDENGGWHATIIEEKFDQK